MIAALANAGRVFERADWLKLACDAFEFVRRDMDAGGDRLWHSWRAGQARNRALIDDYANMARAALALYEAGGRCRRAHPGRGMGRDGGDILLG